MIDPSISQQQLKRRLLLKNKKVFTDVFPAGFEPATLRVWSARDNHYTTETRLLNPFFNHTILNIVYKKLSDRLS